MLTNTFTADACAWCFVMSRRRKHNTRSVFSVPRCMLASKELLPRVAHIGPIFTGQIPPILVYYYICNLHINIDPNATLLVNGDRVTRVQLFMHKNAWQPLNTLKHVYTHISTHNSKVLQLSKNNHNFPMLSQKYQRSWNQYFNKTTHFSAATHEGV